MSFLHFLSCPQDTCLPLMVLGSHLFQIVFGLSAAVIAYQQWKIAKNKIKFEQYDKRFQAYKELQKFLARILQLGKVDLEDLLAFSWKFEDDFFLFGKEIHTYVKNVYDMSQKMDDYDKSLQGEFLKNGERERIENERIRIFNWLIEQPEQSKKLFEKYLRIK